MSKCSICGKQYDINQLLETNIGEYFCKTCVKNYFVVETVPKVRTENALNGKGDSFKKRMFTDCELMAIRRERQLQEAPSQYYTSKKPVRCPHNDCNKYVSVFDLNAHFQYEHPEVPVKASILRNRNPLTFLPRDVRYSIKQCLIILNLIEAPSPNSQHQERVKITMPVLISRVSAANLCEDDEYDFLDEETECNIFSNNDKILIWLGSNTPTPYNCTIAAYNMSGSVRVKYSGPILELKDPPEKICREGYGLILNNYHINGMTENGLRPLNIDVVVHPD